MRAGSARYLHSYTVAFPIGRREQQNPRLFSPRLGIQQGGGEYNLILIPEPMDVAQARRREPAIARTGEEGGPIAPGEPQDLRSLVRAGLSVVRHAAEMRDDDAPCLPVLHRRSGSVDDLDQHMTL